MRESYAEAVEHIRYNTALLRPGVHMAGLTSSLHVLQPKYRALKYSSPMHGVGMCDEWPLIAYPDRFVPGAFDAILEPGLTLCVEGLVGEVGRDHMVKLEDQGVLTENGYETISTSLARSAPHRLPADGAVSGVLRRSVGFQGAST